MDEAGESCSANCAVRNIQRYIIWYKQCRNVNAASALIRLLLKQLNARDYWHCLLMNQIIYINYILFYGVWYYINNALWCTVPVSWELSWQMFASTADWDFSVNLGEVGVCSSSQSDIHVQGCFKGNCFTTQDTGQLLIVFMLFSFLSPSTSTSGRNSTLHRLYWKTHFSLSFLALCVTLPAFLLNFSRLGFLKTPPQSLQLKTVRFRKDEETEL